MKNKILLIVFFPIMLFSQEYINLKTNDKDELKLQSSHFLENSKRFMKELERMYSGKLQREIKSNYEEMHWEFNNEILEGNLLFNDTLNLFIEGILDNIQSFNTNIPDMHFYIAKDGSANAYAMGDQNMIINLGLFYYLDNEAEIAAVISHEIGHQVLNHSIQTQIDQFETQRSSTYKKELAALKKSKFKTQNKALDLLKKQLYELSGKSRINEYQADSIGYAFYKNTPYPKSQYIKALETMQLYDTLTPIGVKTETYRQFFDLPDQPFQDSWLEMEDFSAYNYTYQSKIDEDSTRSHPEIENRIMKLKKIYPELEESNNETIAEPSQLYQKVRRMAYYERIPNLFFNEEYGDGVYLSLLYLQDDPEDPYFKKWLGQNFNEIYKARKNYTLNRYLDRIDPKNQSESYQQFLSFMWNLRLEEIEKIAQYYYQGEEVEVKVKVEAVVDDQTKESKPQEVEDFSIEK